MRAHKRHCRRIQQIRDAYRPSPSDAPPRSCYVPGRPGRTHAHRGGHLGRRYAQVNDDVRNGLSLADGFVPEADEPPVTGCPRPLRDVRPMSSKHYSPEVLLAPRDLLWYRDLRGRAQAEVKQELKRCYLESLRRANLVGRAPKAAEAEAAAASPSFLGVCRRAPRRGRVRSAPVRRRRRRQRYYGDGDDGGLTPVRMSPSRAESFGLASLPEPLREAAWKTIEKELKGHVAYSAIRADQKPALKRQWELAEPQLGSQPTRRTTLQRGLRSGTRNRPTPTHSRSFGDFLSPLYQQSDSSSVVSLPLPRAEASLRRGPLPRPSDAAESGLLYPGIRPCGSKSYPSTSRSSDFAHAGTYRFISPTYFNRILRSWSGARVPPCSRLNPLQIPRRPRRKRILKNRRRSRLSLGRRGRRALLTRRRSRPTMRDRIAQVADYIDNLFRAAGDGDATDECDDEEEAEEAEGWPDADDDDDVDDDAGSVRDADNDKQFGQTDAQRDEASGRAAPVDQRRQSDGHNRDGSTEVESADECSESVVEDWLSFLIQQPLGLLKFFQTNPDQVRSLLATSRKRQRETGNVSGLPVDEKREDETPNTGPSDTDSELHSFLDPELIESCIAEILYEESSVDSSDASSSAAASSVASFRTLQSAGDPTDPLPPQFLVRHERPTFSSLTPQTFSSATPLRPYADSQFYQVPRGTSNYSPARHSPEAGMFQDLTEQYDVTEIESRLENTDPPLFSARGETFENDLGAFVEAVAPKIPLPVSEDSDPRFGFRANDDERSKFKIDTFVPPDLRSNCRSDFPGLQAANLDEDSNGAARYSTRQPKRSEDDTLKDNVRCLVRGICNNIEKLIVSLLPSTTETEAAGVATDEVPGQNDSETFMEKTELHTENAHDVDDGKGDSKKERHGLNLKRHSDKSYRKKHGATKVAHDHQTPTESTSDERSSDPATAREESKQPAQRRKKETLFILQTKFDSKIQVRGDGTRDRSDLQHSGVCSSSLDDEYTQTQHVRKTRDKASGSTAHRTGSKSTTKMTNDAYAQGLGKAENTRSNRQSNKCFPKKHRAAMQHSETTTSGELSCDVTASRDEWSRPTSTLFKPSMQSSEKELPARKTAAKRRDGAASTHSHQDNAMEAHVPHDAGKPAATKSETWTKPLKTSASLPKQPEGAKTTAAGTTTEPITNSSGAPVKNTGVHHASETALTTSSMCDDDDDDDDIHKEPAALFPGKSASAYPVIQVASKSKLKNQLVSEVASQEARPSRASTSQSSFLSQLSKASKSSIGSETSEASKSSKGFRSSETKSNGSKSSKGFVSSGLCHLSKEFHLSSELKSSEVPKKPPDWCESPDESRCWDDDCVVSSSTAKPLARKTARALKMANNTTPRASRVCAATTNRQPHASSSISSSSSSLTSLSTKSGVHSPKTLAAAQQKVTKAAAAAAATDAGSDEASSFFGDDGKPLTRGAPFFNSQRNPRKTGAKKPQGASAELRSQSPSLLRLGSGEFLCESGRSSKRANGYASVSPGEFSRPGLPSSASAVSLDAAREPSDIVVRSSSLLLQAICTTVRETLENIYLYSSDARASTKDMLQAANRVTSDPKVIASLLSLMTTSLRSSASVSSSLNVTSQSGKSFDFEQLPSN